VFGGVRVQVFVGSVGELTAPAAALTPLVGAELTGSAAGVLPLTEDFEHLLVPLAGSTSVEGVVVETGQAMYLGSARTQLEVSLSPESRVLLLGGAPFDEEIVMWWNFVARTHEEVEQAQRQWNEVGDPRFGEVDYPSGERLTAPPMPNVRLRPRGRVR
jgi:redox-sensitive bicupin YhaK (pirin superfamily)